MPETLPLFPLGTVLLPGALLPLHIFEPRYRQLVTDLVTGAVPDRTFGVVAVRPGWNIADGVAEAVYEVGCTAELQDAQRLQDGGFDVITRGMRRFRLLAIDPTAAPYLTATVEWLPDLPTEREPRQELTSASSVRALATQARGAHQRYCSLAWQRDDWRSPRKDVDPAILSHVLASDCLLPLEDRQSLLEQRCAALRLQMIRRLVAREAEFLQRLSAVPATPELASAPLSLN